MQKFVKVVLNLNIFSDFVYLVPKEFEDFSFKFKRVFIPFKNKVKIGFVIEEFYEKEEYFEFKVEKVIDLIDKLPIINENEYKFYKWIADYYIVPLGQVIFSAIPSFNINSLKVKVENDKNNLEKVEKEIVELIKSKIPLSKIQKKIPYFFIYFNRLIEKKVISLTKKSYRITKTDFKVEEFDISYNYKRPERLNIYQQHVWDKLKNYLKNEFSVHLIFGITGSGKTEIYLKAIEEVFKKEKSIIYLVPEIALTPSLFEIFSKNFPDKKIGIIHSKITQSKKNKLWEEISEGKIDIILGARSAIFAPLKNIGLIIVDEEHETSYKQEEKPRYNARDCAIIKGKIYKIPVILGSATPSIRSYYNAITGKYHYYEILYRANLNPLPEVEIIDMKKEKEDKIISGKLKKEIENSVKNNSQVILFINKKGYASYIFCANCGYVFKCKNCDITLTYFKSKDALYCPYCENYYPKVFTCPNCFSSYLRLGGKGTEKIEEKILNELENVKVARFDLFATSKKGELIKILKRFNKGEIDVIVGTQMIAKGHDFKNVNLVGIITVDNILNFPDYTSSERAFQLLVQCSGRAGRDKNKGKVIIQTFEPENYVYKYFKNYDFKGFYESELKFREVAKYPPYYNLSHIIFESLNYDKLKTCVNEIKKFLKFKNVLTLGPSESPIKKIRNKYRFSVLLKSKSRKDLNLAVKKILNLKFPSGVDVKVDIDPENIS